MSGPTIGRHYFPTVRLGSAVATVFQNNNDSLWQGCGRCLPQSYLLHRTFKIKYGEVVTQLKQIKQIQYRYIKRD